MVKEHLELNGNHPWFETEGWINLSLESDTEEELDKVIKIKELEGFGVWIIDNTGNKRAYLYKKNIDYPEYYHNEQWMSDKSYENFLKRKK